MRSATSANCKRPCQRHDLGGEALHLLELRTALEEQEPDAGFLELVHALGHLLGSADEAGAKATIRNGVVLERNLLLELRVRDPVLIVVVARRPGRDVR